MEAQPLVCCVMLTRDRPQMARRAVECFRKQTYQNKRLHVSHTGIEPVLAFGGHEEVFEKWIPIPDAGEFSIGGLRNYANQSAVHINADILIHFDDDDWSHPNRIEEQVALLQASGKQAVGYRDMLFSKRVLCPECKGYTEEGRRICGNCNNHPIVAEAWLYSNPDPRYCLGTSLCYWREAWERRPFPDLSRGEDKAWLREVDSLGVFSSIARDSHFSVRMHPTDEPRMIASVHAGNTSTPDPSTSSNFTRVTEWDSYCRERMAL